MKFLKIILKELCLDKMYKGGQISDGVCVLWYKFKLILVKYLTQSLLMCTQYTY